jgi:hypothetical protein
MAAALSRVYAGLCRRDRLTSKECPFWFYSLFCANGVAKNMADIRHFHDNNETSKKWHLSGREAARHCNGAIFHEISKDTISKIKYTALFPNLMKPLKSSSAIHDYVKVQQLDDICQIRR